MSTSRNDYEQELRSSTWKVEREGDKAVQEQMRAADEAAEKTEAFRDKQDPTYDPNNPAEEAIEREIAGEGAA